MWKSKSRWIRSKKGKSDKDMTGKVDVKQDATSIQWDILHHIDIEKNISNRCNHGAKLDIFWYTLSCPRLDIFWYTLASSRLDILGYNVIGIIVFLWKEGSYLLSLTSWIICKKPKWLKFKNTLLFTILLNGLVFSELVIDIILSLMLFQSLW